MASLYLVAMVSQAALLFFIDGAQSLRHQYLMSGHQTNGSWYNKETLAVLKSVAFMMFLLFGNVV